MCVAVIDNMQGVKNDSQQDAILLGMKKKLVKRKNGTRNLKKIRSKNGGERKEKITCTEEDNHIRNVKQLDRRSRNS